MPTFFYKARDDEGRSISGKVDVLGEDELRKRLESSGFFLVSFKRARQNLFTDDLAIKFQKVSLKDLYSFTIQLNNTVGTGVPLLTSLKTIIEGSKNKKLVRIMDEVINDLKGGSSLSKALAKHPKVFTEFYVSMVELGESSGKLAQTIGSLAQYIKKDIEIKNRISAAMTYPMCVAVIGAGLIGYILGYIMPQFVEIFSKEKVSLPLPTIILLTLSKLITGYWWLVLILIISSIIGFRYFAHTDFGRLFMDRLKLRLPIVGSVTRKICAKRFIDGLHLLYVSGFPLLGALNIVKSMLDNKHLEKTIDALWVHISTGKDFSSYLWLGDFFPADVVAMIRSGEESGTLAIMLEKISEIFHDEVNHSIDGLISAFEIGIIVAMGAVVGFAAMAILFPIFSLSRIAGGH